MTKWRPIITRHFVTLSLQFKLTFSVPCDLPDLAAIVEDRWYRSMSAALRFWTEPASVGYPRTPTRPQAVRRMPKRTFTQGFGGGGFQRRTRGRFNGQRRGRYAGFYRKTGYYGRYKGAVANMRGEGELKFHDIAVDDAVVAAVGGIQNAGSINLIGQATTESTRIGRKCTIRGIGWHYNYTLPEQNAVATPVLGDVLRVILYMDKQANGATAAVTDILESADWLAFNNLANKSRFRILMDKRHSLNYATLAGKFDADTYQQAEVTRYGSFYKKCNIPLEFSGTANPAAITEVRSNNLGVLLISRSGIVGFNSDFRLRFSDN